LNAENFYSVRLHAQGLHTSLGLAKVQLLCHMHYKSHLVISGLHSASLYMMTISCGGDDSCCGVVSYYIVQSCRWVILFWGSSVPEIRGSMLVPQYTAQCYDLWRIGSMIDISFSLPVAQFAVDGLLHR
jgi:hypothetical protein